VGIVIGLTSSIFYVAVTLNMGIGWAALGSSLLLLWLFILVIDTIGFLFGNSSSNKESLRWQLRYNGTVLMVVLVLAILASIIQNSWAHADLNWMEGVVLIVSALVVILGFYTGWRK